MSRFHETNSKKKKTMKKIPNSFMKVRYKAAVEKPTWDLLKKILQLVTEQSDLFSGTDLIA